ncbi:ribonuclease P protein component [Jatrophihabitans telluris]|uniref:Ribonuclease P protein component n=1 Tax=Jatrophihabitans telluris TaxID=2038343 RepID=A0ABY4QYE8_9ACTN|nr:ribonuclease P protein component [Jatrophihabitans telluris]
MRSSADFAAVTRRGRRTRCGDLVVYLSTAAEARDTLVGLVVGKSVGPSVVRHRVARRLRAQLAARLDQVPVGARVVVRALPESADRASVELGRDLDRALQRLSGGVRP